MSKASLFLTVLVIVSLLLVACGTEGTITIVPQQTVPPITADAIETEEGALGTGTPEGAGTADGSDLTTTPAVPVTGEDSPSRLSNLLDYGVWNQNGEQIGEVEDMVLDLDNTMISYVIVGTGGFLELGEKEVAVPWDMLELQTGAGDSQQNAFVFTGDQELYNNAPDTDVSGIVPEIGQAAGDWDAAIRGYWEGGVVPDVDDPTGTPAADGTASPDASVTGTATPAATQAGSQGQGQAQDLQGVILASEVLGSTIQVRGNDQALGTDQGQAVVGTASPDATAGANATAQPQATTATGATGSDQGQGSEMMDVTVEDLIVDPETAEILYMVVTGGFAEGERWIPVPLGFVQWDATNQNFIIRVNAAALQNAPVFEGGQFPDMSAEGWDEEFSSFWDNPDNTGDAGGGTGVEATATP